MTSGALLPAHTAFHGNFRLLNETVRTSPKPGTAGTAAESFGCKQLLHEPFIGGGLWTALALTLVFNIGWFNLLLISCGALLFRCIPTLIFVLKNRK